MVYIYIHTHLYMYARQQNLTYLYMLYNTYL